MLGFAAQFHPGHFQANRQPGAEHFIVVAGNIRHRRAATGMLQNQPQHVVMRGIPVPGFAQAPAVDNVADEVELLAADAAQKIGQEIAAATARSQMQI